MLATDEIVSKIGPEVPWPDSLFHYTTAEGLRGILGTGCLWATNVSYLNDAAELRYWFQVLRDVVDEISRSAEPNEGFLTALTTTDYEKGVPNGVYVACFCDQPDELNQWRTYGNGAGFAIEFEAPTDEAATLDMGPEPPGLVTTLEQVEYRRDEQIRIARTIVDGYLKVIPDPRASTLPELRMALSVAEYVRILARRFAPRVKHPGFASEKEWRIVCRAEDDQVRESLSFRAGGQLLIPYLKLMPKGREVLPIKAIWCGPTSDAALNVASADLLLKRFGYHDVPVKQSGLSLRNTRS